MTRILCGLVLAIGIVPVASAQQEYFVTQSLYPLSSSPWSIFTPPSGGEVACLSSPPCYTSSYYSSGNYGGIGGLLASFIDQYTTTSGGEVKMVVGVDPSNPMGEFDAYLGASFPYSGGNQVPPLDQYSGSFIEVAVSPTGTTTVNLGYTDPGTGNFYEYNLHSTTVTIPNGATIRAILKPLTGTSPYAQVLVYVNDVLFVNYPVTWVVPQNMEAAGQPFPVGYYLGFGVFETQTYSNGTVTAGQGNLIERKRPANPGGTQRTFGGSGRQDSGGRLDSNE
jgi:hypothetical protein